MKSELNAYNHTSIESATPERLVLLLFDGLIKNLIQSKQHINTKQPALAHERLINAQNILLELQGSLNPGAGDLAQHLRQIYSYSIDLLIEANIQKSNNNIDIVINLILPLRDAWEHAVVLHGVQS